MIKSVFIFLFKYILYSVCLGVCINRQIISEEEYNVANNSHMTSHHHEEPVTQLSRNEA